jgi:hypothetical protein
MEMMMNSRAKKKKSSKRGNEGFDCFGYLAEFGPNKHLQKSKA